VKTTSRIKLEKTIVSDTHAHRYRGSVRPCVVFRQNRYPLYGRACRRVPADEHYSINSSNYTCIAVRNRNTSAATPVRSRAILKSNSRDNRDSPGDGMRNVNVTRRGRSRRDRTMYRIVQRDTSSTERCTLLRPSSVHVTACTKNRTTTMRRYTRVCRRDVIRCRTDGKLIRRRTGLIEVLFPFWTNFESRKDFHCVLFVLMSGSRRRDKLNDNSRETE